MVAWTRGQRTLRGVPLAPARHRPTSRPRDQRQGLSPSRRTLFSDSMPRARGLGASGARLCCRVAGRWGYRLLQRPGIVPAGEKSVRQASRVGAEENSLIFLRTFMRSRILALGTLILSFGLTVKSSIEALTCDARRENECRW